MIPNTNIAILGGGIAGLAAAVALKQIGIQTTVFEAAPEIRPVGAGLTLAANAMQALERMQLARPVAAAGRRMSQFAILDHQGKTITSSDTSSLEAQHGAGSYSIHRAELHRVLLSGLDRGQVILGKRTRSVEIGTDGYLVHFADGSSHSAATLIVAEGIHSRVRQQLVPEKQIRYAGYTCWRGIADNGPLGITDTTETWGPRGRFGLVPLADDQLYWFACVQAAEDDPGYRQYGLQDLARQFEVYQPVFRQVLHHTAPDSLIWSDIHDLEPLSQFAYGRLLFIGDAAHATTPNMGQGACQAIEDAVVLADELATGVTVEQAFRNFEQRRIPRTHYIVNQSRRMGWIAQWENRLAIALRNALLRLAPQRINQAQLDRLYSVDF